MSTANANTEAAEVTPATIESIYDHARGGSESYHRFSSLFRRTLLTDGAHTLAETAGAYWLMDAIASHQAGAAKKGFTHYDTQFWQLTVHEKPIRGKKAVLELRHDSGEPAVIRQLIEYTDFPVGQWKLWVGAVDETMKVIMLPTEY